MKRTKLILAAVMSVFMVFGLNAQHFTFEYANYNGPENRVKIKIKKGIRSGELSKKEVRNLNKKMEYIDRMKRKAYKDGHVSKRERKRINHAMYDFDNLLNRYLHNRDVRKGVYRHRDYFSDNSWGWGDDNYDYYYKNKKKGNKKRRH